MVSSAETHERLISAQPLEDAFPRLSAAILHLVHLFLSPPKYLAPRAGTRPTLTSNHHGILATLLPVDVRPSGRGELRCEPYPAAGFVVL